MCRSCSAPPRRPSPRSRTQRRIARTFIRAAKPRPSGVDRAEAIICRRAGAGDGIRGVAMINLIDMGQRARRAARTLALTPTERKNAALEAIASALLENADAVLAANAIDLERGRAAGLSASLLDRMLLTQA